uniref:Protein kinase domain-containing protein n=1 Tax=Amphiprion percula TaxID=161767 RepID=A0A3P8U9H2_AMPPE
MFLIQYTYNWKDNFIFSAFCLNSACVNSNRFTSEFDSIERVGKGAFGCVFKAKQKLLDKYFAIKIVRCKEKALREVGTLSDLHHSNIVRYYTCWMEDSEYQWDSPADSSTTSQLLLPLALQVSKVWGHPDNFMFSMKTYTFDGEVKIGDFGLVTTETDDDAENLMERTEYKGTPSYMAPEQKSRSTYDRKVDIFSLGLIYFELLWNLSAGPERKAVSLALKMFFCYVSLQYQIIRSMLCMKPEDRPEASQLKKEFEDCAHALYTLKQMNRKIRTV